MASTDGRSRLDASSGREVVYCHVCSYEWYRDERESLQCSRCNSEATEIVDPNNDIREPPDDLPALLLFGGRRPHTHSPTGDPDSDPEEGDIEDHLGTGPGEPFMARTIFNSHSRSPDGRERDRDRLGGDGRDDIMFRFAEMLTQMGGRSPPPVPPSRELLFPPPPDRASGEYTFSQPRIQRTTFSSGPFGGTASFTITTGVAGGTVLGSPGGPAGLPNFDTIFGDLMRGGPSPHGTDPHRQPGVGDRPQPGAIGLAAMLQEIIGAAINPANAVHGDVVYNEEALDRIVSQLMEQHPQSNAAPPASQTAIDQLEKKKLTDEMMGSEGKAECTICIDEMHRGDDVTVLPCTHWFHGECVTLWLKEHNTCPICRRAIEAREGRGETRPNFSAGGQQSAGEQSQTAAGPSSSESPLRGRPSPPDGNGSYGSPFGRMGGGFGTDGFGVGTPQHVHHFPMTSGESVPQTRQSPDSHTIHRSYFYSFGSGSGNPAPPSGRTEFPAQSMSDSRDDRERDQTSTASSSGSRRSVLGSVFGDSSSRRDNNTNQNRSGRGSSSGSHNPFSWLREHLPGGSRNSGSGDGNTDRERR
ncbi:hypothetical protein B0H66DRAFT_233378 [Apodospora peruviana]|uniref:RING-type E3 ubiquitin transferase n=1 Tax=Apodospora peruviana TaxID=516989 RepID=A0AAE0M4E8_9PEZI|nr:hypothetical protein B0H66DRAFT_233378 [Apodospora peruviana]